MTLLELRSIIATAGLSESCEAFDIDREKAEKEAIELLDRLIGNGASYARDLVNLLR